MRKDSKNWIDSSGYDLETAMHMLNTGRYIYVIYMCHLSVEKALKAIVTEETGEFPPRTHDLLYLTKLGKVDFPKELLDFIGKLNGANIATRYPEDLQKLLSVYTKEVAEYYIADAKEVISWLRQDSRLAI